MTPAQATDTLGYIAEREVGVDLHRSRRFASSRLSLAALVALALAASLPGAAVPEAHARDASPAVPEAAGSAFKSSFNLNHNGWKPLAGAWSVLNGSYQSAGRKSTYNTIVHTGTYTHLDFSVRMKRKGCPDCFNAIVVRGTPAPLNSYKDWYSGYWFAYDNTGNVSVFRMVAATGAALIPTFVSPEVHAGPNWNVLRVVMSGSAYSFYMNGVVVADGSDPDLTTGRVGIGFFRDVGTGDRLLVDWAKMVLPSADLDPFADAFPGIAAR